MDPWAFTWFDNNSDGTGPYVLGTYSKGTDLTLIKNKQWWNGWQPGSIDEVVDEFVPDTATRVEMVERGTAALTDCGAFPTRSGWASRRSPSERLSTSTSTRCCA